MMGPSLRSTEPCCAAARGRVWEGVLPFRGGGGMGMGAAPLETFLNEPKWFVLGHSRISHFLFMKL